MNRLLLSTSFASIGFLPLGLQTPTKPTPPPVAQTVIVTPVAPVAPVAAVAEIVELLFAPQESPAAPKVVEGWVLSAEPDTVTGWVVSPEAEGVTLSVLPVVSEHGGIELAVSEVVSQEDENAQLRARLHELEAKMAELLNSQGQSQGGEWHTIHETDHHDHSAPSPSQTHRVRVHKVGEASGEAHQIEKHQLFSGDGQGGMVFRSGPNSQGNVHFFGGGQGQTGTQKFPGGMVKVRSNQWPAQSENVEIWATDHSGGFFQLDMDDCDDDCEEECCGDCEDDCEDDCEAGQNTGRRFISIGSGSCDFDDIDFEELGFDLEDLDLNELHFDMSNIDFDEMDIDLEDFGFDLEDLEISLGGMDIDLSELDISLEDLDLNLEDMDFDFEDLDIDLEELIGSGVFDDNELMIQVGLAGPGAHGNNQGPQTHVVRKQFVTTGKPQVTTRRVAGATRLRGRQGGTAAPQTARSRSPRRLAARSSNNRVRVGTPAPLGMHGTGHDAHEEWTDLLEEMHDELRELRDVIGDLSRELRNLANERHEGHGRKSMR